MIEIKNYAQSIVLTGDDEPTVTIMTAPAQSITVTATGAPGPAGPPGPAGTLEDADLPDFTLIFENHLI